MRECVQALACVRLHVCVCARGYVRLRECACVCEIACVCVRACVRKASVKTDSRGLHGSFFLNS